MHGILVFLRRAKSFLASLSFYLLMTILPVAVFTVWMSRSYFGVLEEKTLESNRAMLGTFSAQFDDELLQLFTLATQTYSDADLTYAKLSSNPLNTRSAIELLEKYGSGRQSVFNLILYHPQSGQLYTATTTLSLSEYGQSFMLAGMDTETFRAALSNTAYASLFPETTFQRDHTSPAQVIPFFCRPGDNRQAVLFLLNARYFHKILNTYQSSMLVVDAVGTPILSSWTDGPSEALLAACAGVEDRFVYDGVGYLLSRMDSAIAGLTYVSVHPLDDLLSDVLAVRQRFSAAMLWLALLLLLLTLLGMRVNYQPLRRLSRIAKRLLPEAEQKGGDLETVHLALDQLSAQRERLGAQYTKALPALREHLLARLLEDGFATQRDYNQLAAEADAQLTCTFFQVAAFKFSRPVPHDCRAQMLRRMQERLSDVQGYGAFLPNHLLAFVFSTNEQDGLEPGLIEALYEAAAPESDAAWCGVGTAYPGIHQIPKSHMEAMYVLDGCSPRNRGIIRYEGLLQRSLPDTVTNMAAYLSDLETALVDGDPARVSSVMDDLERFIVSEDLPMGLVRCMGYDVINTLIKITHLISQKYKDALAEDFPGIIQMIRFQSASELMLLVRDYCAGVCRIAGEYRENNIAQLARAIRAYVDENYCEYDFSSQSLADNLGVSVSTVKKYFKQDTGTTPMEYANELRIARAKQLLAETDDPLRTLIQKLGYSDVSAFVRKFREEVGITPGQYRKLYGMP